MGEKTGEPPDVGGEPDAAVSGTEADEVPPGRPKLHMTGKGLSPAEYAAQHGGHPHQADFSRGADGGDDSTAEGSDAADPTGHEPFA